MQRKIETKTRGELFVERVYKPSLVSAVHHRYVVVSVFFALGMLMFGYCKGGNLGFVSMPTVDRLRVSAYFDLPSDTPLEKTDMYVKRIAAAVDQLRTEFMDGDTGNSLILNVHSETGDAHWHGSEIDETQGQVSVEVLPPSLRSEPGPKNSVIANRWKEIVGEIPEAHSFNIRGERSRRRGEREEEPIEIELRGKSSEKKVEIAHAIVD